MNIPTVVVYVLAVATLAAVTNAWLLHDLQQSVTRARHRAELARLRRLNDAAIRFRAATADFTAALQRASRAVAAFGEAVNRSMSSD